MFFRCSLIDADRPDCGIQSVKYDAASVK